MKFSTPAFVITLLVAAGSVAIGLALGWAVLDLLTIAVLIVIVAFPALSVGLRPPSAPTWSDDADTSPGSCRRTIAVISQELGSDTYGAVTTRILRDLPDAPQSPRSSDIITYARHLSASSKGDQS